VAILVTDGFEQVELTEPRKALDEAGATTKIVSPKHQRVRAWNFTDWSIELPVDVDLDRAKPEDFDALLLPGGVINPDSLRIEPNAVAFAKAFFDAAADALTVKSASSDNGRKQDATKHLGPALSISLEWRRSPSALAATRPISSVRSSG
jgi:hypothetical protein